MVPPVEGGNGPLDLAGDVVVVTGASLGLGRAHARALAGADGRVVVNGRSNAVHDVVAEIRQLGGVAAASQRDVRDGAAIVDDTLEAFGRVDAVVLNAGIIRDQSFRRMTDENWDEVLDVNLGGARAVLGAAWPHLLEQQHGRVVITASSAGFHGNPGQANYSATKAGLIGLGRALAIEGRTRGVLVNTIAPVAATPMTSEVFPFEDDVIAALGPERVSPIVVAMCHRSWTCTNQVVETGGGWIATLRWQRSRGVRLSPAELDSRAILERWSEISDYDESPEYPTTSWDPVARAADMGPEDLR